MKTSYDPGTDSLYIALRPLPSKRTVEIEPDVMLDCGEDGEPVGYDIQHASGRTDRSAVWCLARPLSNNASRCQQQPMRVRDLGGGAIADRLPGGVRDQCRRISSPIRHELKSNRDMLCATGSPIIGSASIFRGRKC